jgi:uncharacterized protein with PIN domain
MGVKYIVDAQLPPALARALRDRGVDAAAVRGVELREADDSDIWRYAIENDAAIISKGEDFAERFCRALGTSRYFGRGSGILRTEFAGMADADVARDCESD